MSAPISTLGNGRLALYSLRYSPARGYHYAKERDVTTESAARWTAVFQADEPRVEFVIASADRPPLPRAPVAFRIGAL